MKSVVIAGLMLMTAVAAWAQGGRSDTDALADATRELIAPTGILYDRVVGFSHIDRYDGEGAPALNLREWRQIYHEVYRASQQPPTWPSLGEVKEGFRGDIERGIIPIAVMDFEYNRLREDAVATGALQWIGGRVVAGGRGNSYEHERVFAAGAMKDYTHRGQRVVFSVSQGAYYTNRAVPEALQMDFDDGSGFRPVQFGEQPVVHYASPGRKTVRVRAASRGVVLTSSFDFEVANLVVPSPDDTLSITATVAYNGQYASGEAYVYLAPGHAVPTQPIIVVEGFDLDDTYNWDELYTQLNQENLVEDLRAMGFDAVVLNFTEATDYIQRNAFVVTELIEQVQSFLAPQTTIAVVGASMGGLVTRYALAWMEANAMDHRVRTFIAFDSPERGANIPLGIQYWLKFFEGLSADAAFLLSRLDTPAARQMLVYHYTDPPTGSPGPDPLQAVLDDDFALIGAYPSGPRLVAIINGSSTQAYQGFSPGNQIILYDYDSFTYDVVGNVWAVPDGTGQTIFNGSISFLGFPVSQQQISVSGTLPYDGAPGGSRASMAQMDATPAPYGDIIAVHDSHCFIPSISALGLGNTTDPFYDIANDPMILANSPFDAVYYPAVNQPHVTVTPENKPWIISEVTDDATGIPDVTPPGRRTVLYQNSPNPFNPSTSIRFELGQAGHVTLAVYNALGGHVVTLLDDHEAAGARDVRWDGRDAAGQRVGSGVYFYRIDAGGASLARKMVLLK